MLALLPVMALAVAAPIATPNPDAMRLRVEDAHAAPAAAGGSTAIGMLLVNQTSSSLVLVGASTPVAGQTVLQHYVKTPQGVVQIEPLANLPLPMGSETILAPGAVELQLVGLTQPLEAGLELPLTLKFADGTKRVIRIQVEGDNQ